MNIIIIQNINTNTWIPFAILDSTVKPSSPPIWSTNASLSLTNNRNSKSGYNGSIKVFRALNMFEFPTGVVIPSSNGTGKNWDCYSLIDILYAYLFFQSICFNF